nr:zinc finger, CCHC-type [Tanacetum cinerariifolium]
MIEPKENTQIDNKKDKVTTALLYQALTEDVILQVASCKTAKELLESLRKRHVGEEKVQQAWLQSLMIGFNTLQMKDDDTVDAFTAKLNGYATKAKELGKTLDESLLAFEERIKLRKGGQDESQENLLFAQGEHSGKERRFNKRGGRSNYSRGNWRNNKTRNNSKERNSNHKENSNRNKGEWDLSKVRCYKCQKLRHLRKDCRVTSITQEQSNLILEDDEPSLLMTTHEEVLLNEGQIQPAKYASGDASIWYLDNGASNHMTGVKSHFKDIIESISGRVRFGDGSYVQINGRGSIILGYRNQEQKIVSDVYYIPNLKSNILSLGQLTEIGCKVIMDGNKLTLYDKNKKLLMKVERSKNRLYCIRLQIKAPICLLANVDNQAWLWHARLGHLNFDNINKMTRKNLVDGIPRIDHAGQVCDACLLGKHSRTPFPNQAKFRSKNPLDLVYGDLCGPISPATHLGKKLIFLVPTRALVDKTTYEALYNRKPNLEKLRIFGCTAYAKITIPYLKKLDDISIPLIYLGVEEGSKACRLYDPIAKKKHVSRDVKFMETKLWDWNEDGEDTCTQDIFWASFVVEGVDNENTTPVNTEINDDIDDTYQEPDLINDPNSPITPPTYTYNPHLEKEEEAITSSIKNSEKGFDHVPVFKTKRDAEGKIIKYKARLVAKGYVQEQGINFDEVFSLVARIEIVRLILALAAYHGWQVHHLDVKSAFLHGDLKEEVYVTQPEGFVKQGNTGKVYKLIKDLYGLREAPRAWNVKLDQTLKSLDFKKCNLEQAVYTRRSKTSTLIVGVYVDDLIITGTPRKEIDAFKSQMKDRFEMSDLGLFAYYLGIEVTQTGGEITIKQTRYINKILKETSMMDSNETKIPMDLVKQVIRYMKGTMKHGIIYKKEGGCKITGYNDSSYGINTDQGKGTTGIVFYFGESPITWCTQKQPIVAFSSCESEFMAATGAACQALWLKRLLSELTRWKEERITLKVDNVLAIALVMNPIFHGRSKHIDIHYHYIHECVKNGHINVEHISGELQRADILTKALPRLKFMTMRQMLVV